MRKGHAADAAKRKSASQPSSTVRRKVPTRPCSAKPLQTAEPLCRLTIDSLVDDAIHVVDQDLQILLINETFNRWCDRLGLPRGRAGQSLFEVFPFLPKSVIEEYQLVCRTGKPLATEETTEVAGEAVVTETRKVPILERGKVTRVITVVRGISERKRMEARLRQSEENLAKTFRSSPNLIAISTIDDGRIIEVNASVFRTLGYRREEMIGKTVKELNIYEDSGSRDLILQQLLQQGFVHDADVSLRTREGDIRKCIFSAEIIEMNGQRVMLTAVADITERKRAEAILLDSHRELEQLVQQRTSQLRALAKQLTQAEQDERSRVSRILHEDLQQLLVGVQYRLGGLMKDVSERKAQSALQDISLILDQAVHVTRSISCDLRPPVLHEAGLAAALVWLANDMRRKFDLAVDVQADPEAEPASEGLRTMVFQAVRELLFNVNKHAGIKEARVRTSVEADSLRVEVKDNGSGFNTVLSRPDSLGLFSTRERVGFFGGQVQVISAPGQGTCVTLTIPMR